MIAKSFLPAGFVVLVGSVVCNVAVAENWPQWRGPLGTGVSGEQELPIAWSERRSLLWKCALPEWGRSTPAIWDDAIFVTSHDADDKLLLMRIDKKSGEIVWTREVGHAAAPREAAARGKQTFHRLHNLASPSPVTDGKRIVAHFGNGDLAAYDFDGKQLWKRNLQEDYGAYTIWWGHANSPVIYEGVVISACLQDSLADVRDEAVESYLVAHDLRDGHVKWKVARTTKADAEQCDAYTTPLLVKTSAATQLIVMGGNQLDGYDPLTGKQRWFLPRLIGGRTVTGPTAGNGLVFATQGMKGPLIAVRVPDELPRAEPLELTRRNIVWKRVQSTPDTCCPVLWHRWLFAVTDDGIAACYDSSSGNLRWRRRLKGNYKASPIAVEGRVFFLNTEGLCTVVSAAPHFDRLLENQLDDETIASPAVSGGRLFIRGRKALYCIGRQVVEP